MMQCLYGIRKSIYDEKQTNVMEDNDRTKFEHFITVRINEFLKSMARKIGIPKLINVRILYSNFLASNGSN
jgi:hypothetical protein